MRAFLCLGCLSAFIYIVNGHGVKKLFFNPLPSPPLLGLYVDLMEDLSSTAIAWQKLLCSIWVCIRHVRPAFQDKIRVLIIFTQELPASWSRRYLRKELSSWHVAQHCKIEIIWTLALFIALISKLRISWAVSYIPLESVTYQTFITNMVYLTFITILNCSLILKLGCSKLQNLQFVIISSFKINKLRESSISDLLSVKLPTCNCLFCSFMKSPIPHFSLSQSIHVMERVIHIIIFWEVGGVLLWP